jgi:hypothetical protein
MPWQSGPMCSAAPGHGCWRQAAPGRLRALPQAPPRRHPERHRMPVHDGYEFLRWVRALPATEGGDTPAAAFTAYARPETGSGHLPSAITSTWSSRAATASGCRSRRARPRRHSGRRPHAWRRETCGRILSGRNALGGTARHAARCPNRFSARQAGDRHRCVAHHPSARHRQFSARVDAFEPRGALPGLGVEGRDPVGTRR